MLELKKLKKALDAVGIPVAYSHYEEAHAFPYIVYEQTRSDGYYADNINFMEIATIQIDLYSRQKDPQLERKVRKAITSLELPFTTIETIVQGEDCYAVSYFVETFLKAENEDE